MPTESRSGSGHTGDQPPLSEAEKIKIFKEIQDSIHIGGKELNKLFEFFGEPPRMTPATYGNIIFHYPLGDIHVYASSLIKLSDEMKYIGSTELSEPWASSPTGQWEGPFSNTHSVIAHFSLDRVPGSSFPQAVIKDIGMGFPPTINHPTFDLLDPATQTAIVNKLKPNIPTPEQSAAEHWQDVARNENVKKMRHTILSLQVSGKPVWHGKDLFIGQRKIDLEQFYIRSDDKIFAGSAENAVNSLLETARDILDHYLDPLDHVFVPKKDEPLLGIPSVETWKTEYAASFEKLRKAAGWDEVDATKLRRLRAETALPASNIVGRIELPRAKGTAVNRLPQHGQPAAPQKEVPRQRKDLHKIEVDNKGWFKCKKGHVDKIGSGDLKKLKAKQKIELFCKNCNEIVGFAE